MSIIITIFVLTTFVSDIALVEIICTIATVAVCAFDSEVIAFSALDSLHGAEVVVLLLFVHFHPISYRLNFHIYVRIADEVEAS